MHLQLGSCLFLCADLAPVQLQDTKCFSRQTGLQVKHARLTDYIGRNLLWLLKHSVLQRLPQFLDVYYFLPVIAGNEANYC